MHLPRAAAGCVLAALVVTGCGGSGSPGASPPSTPSPVSCPTPTGPTHPLRWPVEVPQDMPKVPNGKIVHDFATPDGVHVTELMVPDSLRESVLFVVRRLPKAGFALGRGDAEATEADAPFVHGSVRGLVRMVELGDCRTEWLLATVNAVSGNGNSPLLTPHTPSGSPSPLPFA